MKGMKYILVGAVFALIALVTVTVLLNPLRGSEERIENGILEATPIGMNIENVVSVIDLNSSWELRWTDGEPRGGQYIAGERFVEAFLGEYFSLRTGHTPAVAFWGFDADGNLIDLLVIKEPDIALW